VGVFAKIIGRVIHGDILWVRGEIMDIWQKFKKAMIEAGEFAPPSGIVLLIWYLKYRKKEIKDD